mmetsp:Transcript_2134/g.9464  ORF Transcript_2134/g.9464 Transcript_2134/m.9464 type:complete len:371 (-) Transcript_2134:226-1338(-)
MIALLARVAVILCIATPRAAATETWEQRLRRESIKVDGDEVTTMSVEALQAHIAHHALDQEPREMSGPWVDDPAANDDDAKRMLDVDDAAKTTSSRGPAPVPASTCAPPGANRLVKFGWEYNAWRYYPAPVDASPAPVYYSVGVGRDLTFDAALLRAHPNLEAHAFDNTPVASQFVKALGRAGGVPARWRWHELLLAGRDVREIEVALPKGRSDSFTPASANGVYHDLGGRPGGQTRRVIGVNEGADGRAKRLPARPLWRVMDALSHAYVDVLKVDVEGAEFDVVDAWEGYYGDRGPPACQLLFEWHERFYPEGGVGQDKTLEDKTPTSGRALREGAEAALNRMGFKKVACDGSECVYWNCNRCPSLQNQ